MCPGVDCAHQNNISHSAKCALVLVALRENTYCMNRCATERGEKWNKTTLFRLCAGVNKNLHSDSGFFRRKAEMDIC